MAPKPARTEIGIACRRRGGTENLRGLPTFVWVAGAPREPDSHGVDRWTQQAGLKASNTDAADQLVAVSGGTVVVVRHTRTATVPA